MECHFHIYSLNWRYLQLNWRYLQLNWRYLQYIINLQISTIQLEISPNRLNYRYLQLNWRYLQINCRYLQILSIWRYLQSNCTKQFGKSDKISAPRRKNRCAMIQVNGLIKSCIYNYRLFVDISNSIVVDICKSIVDISNSIGDISNSIGDIYKYCLFADISNWIVDISKWIADIFKYADLQISTIQL